MMQMNLLIKVKLHGYYKVNKLYIYIILCEFHLLKSLFNLDTEYANKTSTERALDVVQSYWEMLQPLLKIIYIMIVLMALGSTLMIITARNKNGYCNSDNVIEKGKRLYITKEGG